MGILHSVAEAGPHRQRTGPARTSLRRSSWALYCRLEVKFRASRKAPDFFRNPVLFMWSLQQVDTMLQLNTMQHLLPRRQLRNWHVLNCHKVSFPFLRRLHSGKLPSFNEVYRSTLHVLFNNIVFIWINPITGFTSSHVIFSQTARGIIISGTSNLLEIYYKMINRPTSFEAGRFVILPSTRLGLFYTVKLRFNQTFSAFLAASSERICGIFLS